MGCLHCLRGESGASANGVLEKLHRFLKERKSQPVDLAGLKALEAAEKAHSGETDCIGEFKFAANQDMLRFIQQSRQ